jgi:hypothetical protein
VCVPECANSYCASAAPDATCSSCMYSSRTETLLSEALLAQCTSATCARYEACVQAAPATP